VPFYFHWNNFSVLFHWRFIHWRWLHVKWNTEIISKLLFQSFFTASLVLSCYSCCFLCCYRYIVFAVAIAINIHWYIAVSIATATNRIRDRADQSVAVRSSCRNTTCSIILILPFRHLLTSSLRGLRQLLLSSLAHCLAVAVLATVMILSSKWPSNENTWQELQLQYSSLVYSIYCNYNKCNMSRGVRVRISSRNISAMQGVSVTLPTVLFYSYFAPAVSTVPIVLELLQLWLDSTKLRHEYFGAGTEIW